ncbi:MAG: primosomal protein N', partial [Bacteroidales bacterium]|nr:primosomal protein N' [Bacteroidales bacterium]
MERDTFFVEILLPLPLKGTFTYRVPYQLNTHLKFGVRAIVPFGKNKLYSGIIVKVHQEVPQQINIKYIVDVIDTQPLISEKQFALWQWIARYYMCTLGEVMTAALPSSLKLAGETQIHLHPNFDGDLTELSETEIHIVENVAHSNNVTISDISKILNIPKIIPIVKTLVEKQIIVTTEEIRDSYRPKKENYISLAAPYNIDEAHFYQLLDSLEQSKKTIKQSEVILAFLVQLQKECGKIDLTNSVKKSALLSNEKVSSSSLQTLIDKNILISKEVTISRLIDYEAQSSTDDITLTEPQQQAIQSINTEMLDHQVVLLHGVTGSGKTEIYIKMIDQVLKEGKQVLYLLPEIALTSQIVNRLRKFFGEKVGVYHSRFNEYERVEIWSRVLHSIDNQIDNKYQLILGARSALLLPFQNLGLIIVDEEHDASYKQMEPAPRYHARDSAIVLANIHHAKVLLGTATPSLETYYNVEQHKYGLVELTQRFAQGMMPEIWISNMVESTRQKKVNGIFSQFLLDQIAEALEKKEQIILFQNRRGFSLRMFCHSCQTMPTCKYCDVTLTYHKHNNLLKCHYCGYAIEVPKACPNCHSVDLEMKGFGTEKVED